MMKQRRFAEAALALATLLLMPAGSASGQPHGTYELGFRQVARLESDMFSALEPKRRRQVSFETTLLQDVRVPCLVSAPGADSAAPGGPVQVSLAFVDFLNRLAHAKAYDESEPGFFIRYTARLADDTRSTPVLDFDALLPKKAWNFQTLNRQASHFNQMAGGLVAIDLAHHYLGHYRKHGAAFGASAALPLPINTLVTESEWRAAVLRGSENALACGLGADGLRTVFECFSQMPQRPAWAAYFIHPGADVRRINAELAKQERGFFAMDSTPRAMTGRGGGSGR